MERCKYELFVEKYYGLNPETVNENGIIKTDYGDLCNLLAMFDNEQLEAKISHESSGLNKPVVIKSVCLKCGKPIDEHFSTFEGVHCPIPI